MEETKNCPHCQKEISKKATRCPHCQADLHSWVNRHPILTVLLVIIGVGILSSLSNSRNQTPASSATVDTTSTPTASTSIPATSTPTSAPKAVSETPSAPSPSWHVAYTYTNDTSIQTQPFVMHGGEWKITYTCDATPGYFGGDIDSASSGSYTTQIANNPSCPTTQSSYAYGQSAGQYYLNISSTGPSYSITVQDYY